MVDLSNCLKRKFWLQVGKQRGRERKSLEIPYKSLGLSFYGNMIEQLQTIEYKIYKYKKFVTMAVVLINE